MSKLFIFIICFFTYISAQTVNEKFDAGIKAYNDSQFVEANRLFDKFLKDYSSYD